MTTRIDARFAELQEAGPLGLRHLPDGRRSRSRDLARHHQGAAEGRRRHHRDRHALHRSDGGRSVDPGGGPARAEGRHDPEEDAGDGARLPQGRRRDAAGADGLLQSDLHLRRRQIPRRCQVRRRRRPDHRRPAAGGRHRTVPAGDEGRAQFHPAGDADHRRQAPARGAREHVRALSITSRSPASPAAPAPIPSVGRRGRRPHQAAYQIAGLRRLRHPHAGGRARHRAKAPMARWSAPRWSMPCAAASMPRAARRPKPSAPSPIWWPRWRRACGARNRPQNKPQLRWR